MTTLTRNSTGLLLREDFSSGTGWTAGTGFSRVADPALITFGAAPQVLLAPRTVGQPDYDGVREGQLYVESGTWYLLYDAGDDSTGWRQYLATSSDRGLTWSRAVQSIQLDNGSSGSYAAVATGWLEKRSSTYYLHRVTTAGTFASPDVGLPADPYGWDIWHCSTLTGTWVFDRAVTPAGSFAASLVPGATVLDSGTYYHFIEGYTTGSYKIGIATASLPGGAYTIGSIQLQSTDFFGFTPENAKVFYHPTLLTWVMLVNLIDPSNDHTSRNALAFSSLINDWSAATKLHTQWKSAVCDTNGNAIGVQTHVTGPDGALVHEDGFIPFVYDADPRASSPGWHRGRSIRSAVYEPAAYRLHYTDATTTPHRYSKSLSHTDFVAEFETDSSALVSGSYIALEFRTNGTTGYRLMWQNEAGGKLRLETMAGTTVQNGSGTAGTSGMAMRIKVSAQGTTLKAWLNGELQVNVTDSTYSSGTEIAFVGKNCTADVRLFHVRSNDSLTIRGLGAGEQIWLRTHGELPYDTVTADGSGVATYSGTHYPLSRIEGSAGDQLTSDGLLWGGDDVTYDSGVSVLSLYDPAIYDPAIYDTGTTPTATPPTDYALWLLEDHPRCFLLGVQYAYAGTPSPPVNVASAANGATVSAPLGSGSTKPVSAVIDGDRNGPFNGGTWAQLNSIAVDPHPSVEITFAGSEDVYEVRVYHVQDTGTSNPTSQPVIAWEQEANVATQCGDWAITDYTLDYWDGAAWVTFCTVTDNTNALNVLQYGRDYDTLPTSTKIRLYVNDTQDGVGAGKRARLQEIEVYNGLDPLIGTHYFSTLPFSANGDVYDTSILSLPAFSQAVNADTLTGLASVSVSGPAVFNNKDGHLDWMKTAIFDGRPCTLLCGDPSWDVDDFETVYTVYAKKAIPTPDRTIVFEVSDGSFLAGTITPAVVRGTTQPAPIPFGKTTVQMYLEDAGTNRWRFCDPPYWNTPLKETGIVEIWDGGVSLNGAIVLPSASAPPVATYYDSATNTTRSSAAYVDGSTAVDMLSVPLPRWDDLSVVVYVSLAVPSAATVSSFSGDWDEIATATMGDAVVHLYRRAFSNGNFGFYVFPFVAHFSTSTVCSASVIVMAGCDTAAEDDVDTATGTTSPITAAAGTASGASDTLLTFWFARGTVGVTLGTASGSGTVEQIEGYSSDGSTSFWAQSICTQGLSASGSTGTRTVTITNGSGANCAISVLVKPQASATVSALSDDFTVTNHGIENDDVVYLEMSAGGTAPGGLVDSNTDNSGRFTQYWAVNCAPTTFQLSATRGGSAINITSAGSGSITFTARKYWDVGDGSVLLNDTPTATPMAKVVTTNVGPNGYYISDLLRWVHLANGGQLSMWGGTHPSYIAGSSDSENLDPLASTAITAPVGVFTLWDTWAKSACAFVAFDNDGQPYIGRVRTNPLDLPVDPDDFNTSTITFTDQDVLGSKSLGRLDPKWRLASIIAEQNRPPMSQASVDADASVVQTLKAKGVLVTMPDLVAGDYSTRPDLYHIGMIDTRNMPTEIVSDSTYSIAFLNNFVSRLYPFIDRRTFQAPWRAHQLLLGDKVTVNQPNAFADEADIEGQIIAKTLRPYDGSGVLPSVDVTVVYRTEPDSTTADHG